MHADLADPARGEEPSSGPLRPWHIITGEYPPLRGGVGDYAEQLAAALAAAGDEVHIWAPPGAETTPGSGGVTVHRLADHFRRRGLADLTRGLDRFPAPRRLLVQYVAGAFGMRSMNVPFCLWLARRRADHVWMMFHEYAYPLRWLQKPHHALLGIVTHAMGRALAGRADRVFVSTPAWLRFAPLARRAGADVAWLPVPSNLPARVDAAAVRAVRGRLAPDPRMVIVGHFSSHQPAVAAILQEVLPRLLRSGPERRAVLIGRGGGAVREALLRGGVGEARVTATGGLPALDTALHLRACDILVQPYPDGATTRRGSLMAGLALGLPIVTNEGQASETIWRETGAATIASDPSPEAIAAAAEVLLGRRADWSDLGRRAAALYEDRFSLGRTVGALRELGGRDDRLS